jgi:enoyl-CoA hydratase/carnithine racemase
MQSLNRQFRSLPQVTIAKLAGTLAGGGNEFAMALDMRFAAIDRTVEAGIQTRAGELDVEASLDRFPSP